MFLAAVAVITALGSVIQTQINLAAVLAMGAPVPWGLRLLTIAQDLVGFTPALGGIVTGAFLAALPGLTAPLLHWTPSMAPSALAVYRGSRRSRWPTRAPACAT